MRDYSTELNINQKEILTTQCNEYVELYNEQSVTNKMEDGTKITMLIPINKPDKNNPKDTFIPDYNDQIEDLA